ncbi:MAG TPA: hypothetical protein GXZ60_06115 [Intrasporangiaceae bacterium]|nr:hypothetical protein [Intrasporangiaceae bacterium]
MTAVPALSPLTITPVPRRRMVPTPLPGEPFPEPAEDPRFIQEALRFTDIDEDDTPRAMPALPDPRPLAASIAQALVEVLAGRRPVIQLIRWTTPAVYAALSARSTVAHRRRLGDSRAPSRVTVRRVVVRCPQEGIAEVAIVVIDGTRVRAMAARMRADHGRWIVDALQVG